MAQLMKNMEKTTAWVLYKQGEKQGLIEEQFEFPSIGPEEVLIEPLFGCWEGNIEHALQYDPLDVCVARGEKKVVLGNAGVVRVLKVGENAKIFQEGDICMLFGIGKQDKYGYPIKAIAYDMPGSIGLLSKRSKVPYYSLIKIPEHTKYTLQQWAAFSIRFVTAWANWKMAYAAYRLQVPEELNNCPFIFAWGGGVSLAQSLLAKIYGFEVAMMSSQPARLSLFQDFGIIPIDQRQYKTLHFEKQQYESNNKYKREYTLCIGKLKRDIIKQATNKEISIIFDHIGGNTFKASLRLLDREGVIATSGWKAGMDLSYKRASECINRHFHIHTHYAKMAEGIEAINFAEENNWYPPINSDYYTWNNIPILAEHYSTGKIVSYFPIYQIND